MTWLQALRWLLIFEILMQPFICVWLVVIALRIRRDQERIRLFVNAWSDRMSAITAVPDVLQLVAIKKAIDEHDEWAKKERGI